jgi:predicted unusual protein kinase regulating ubiquinone biosynthesis (AarF/ABC1/UbiB family)
MPSLLASPSETFQRIDALIQVGLRLARAAPSGRILLARIADSIDLGWIPRPWGDGVVAELEAAHTEAREEIALPEIERILAAAWGVKPSDELDDLDPDPVAVTPSSQVHRAVLHSAPVAVKVLRPGLAASVRQDLALLEGLLSPLGAAFPGLDPGAVVREFRERVLDELDLEHEATMQRRFHRALRNHPFLAVPAPVTEMAHESVLVSEWVDGVPLWQAQNPDEAAARLVLFVLGGLRAGIIHADPHPDDVLALDDGRLAILDFGATRTVQDERVQAAGAAVEAFAEDDADEFGAALERLGALPASHAPVLLDLLRHALGDLAGPKPARLDSQAVLAARDRLFDRPRQLGEVIAAGAMPPEDLWPARGAVQVFATIARVGATGPWRELTRAALRDGWAADVERAIAYES